MKSSLRIFAAVLALLSAFLALPGTAHAAPKGTAQQVEATASISAQDGNEARSDAIGWVEDVAWLSVSTGTFGDAAGYGMHLLSNGVLTADGPTRSGTCQVRVYPWGADFLANDAANVLIDHDASVSFALNAGGFMESIVVTGVDEVTGHAFSIITTSPNVGAAGEIGVLFRLSANPARGSRFEMHSEVGLPTFGALKAAYLN